MFQISGPNRTTSPCAFACKLRQLRGLLREGVAGGEEALRDESVTTCISVGALVAQAGDGDTREGAQGEKGSLQRCLAFFSRLPALSNDRVALGSFLSVIFLLASTAAFVALATCLARLVSGIQGLLLHVSPQKKKPLQRIPILCKILYCSSKKK